MARTARSAGKEQALHSNDTESYPGSGHLGGVKPYSYMSGIAPVKMIVVSYKFEICNGRSLSTVP